MKTEYVAVVSAADALEGGLPWSETLVYVFAQIFGTSVERCWPISCFRFHSCHCPGTCGADPPNSPGALGRRYSSDGWFQACLRPPKTCSSGITTTSDRICAASAKKFLTPDHGTGFRLK